MAANTNDAYNQHLPANSIAKDLQSSTYLWVLRHLIMKTKCPKTSFSFDGTNSDSTKLPHPNTLESSEINNARFQTIFRQEEAAKGHLNMSMLIVVWRFGGVSLMVACLLQTVAIALGFVGTIGILCHMESNFYIFYVGCMFGMYYLKSVSNWLNMRTAIRLRTACIAAAYSKSLESSIANRIPSYQTIYLTAGVDNEPIIAMVLKGTALFSHTIGLIVCAISAIMLLEERSVPFIWTMFLLKFLTVVLVTISTRFHYHSQFFLDKKLGIIDDYCRSFSKETFIKRYDDYTRRFSNALSCQYLGFSRAELFMRFCSVDTMILLFLAFFIRLGHSIPEFEVMTVILVAIAPVLIFELREALDAIMRGRPALDSVKIAMSLTPTAVPPSPNFDRSAGDLHAISITEAKWQWTSDLNSPSSVENSTFVLHVQQMHISKGSIIGITGAKGAGKSSLVYALLGHITNVSGHIRRNGNLAFFPEKPYMVDDKSVKENVCFYQTFDAAKYDSAMALVKLGQRCLGSVPVCEDMPVGELELSAQQLQKISLARAFYCDSEIIILENPTSTSATSDEQIVFTDVVTKLIAIGKSVILVAQNDSPILRLCSEIYLLHNGNVVGKYNYDELLQDNVFLQHFSKSPINTARDAVQPSGLQSNEMSEQLVQEITSKRITGPAIWYYIWMCGALLPIFVINSICLEAVALLIRGLGSHAYYGFIFLWLALIAKCITAPYLYKAPSRYNKRIQREMFKKLLNTSMENVSEAKIASILNIFMDSHIPLHQLYFTIARCYVEIVTIGAISYGVGLTSVQSAMMIVGIIYYAIIYSVGWNSILTYADSERKTRFKLLRHTSNQYNGRAVIQSFNVMKESRSSVFSIVDENSTAVFLRLSIRLGAQFIFHCLQILFLTFELTYQFPPGVSYLLIIMFIFPRITRSIDTLLDTHFDAAVLRQKIDNVDSFMEVTDSSLTTINDA